MHVVSPAAFGGLERMVQQLAAGLQERGHDVHVVVTVTDAASAEPFLWPLAHTGVWTHVVEVSARAYGRERAAVAALCGRLQPDAVHTHGYRPDVVDAGVARRLGIPVVSTAHGFTGGPWRNRAYEYLQRRAFRRFDAVIAVSRPLGERLARSGVRRSRLHVVPNAWRRASPALDRSEARRVLHLPQEAFVVGWVGRFSSEKGPDVLIEALPRLRDLSLTAIMVGGGSAEQKRALEARADELHVADQIRLSDAIPSAERLFKAFDVFVLSSHTEGTPVVLFEAMAAGVPIVTTRVGGVPDVVSPEEAVLVRSGDRIALAAGIREVYTQPVAAARRAQAARVRLDRDFGVESWLDRYEQIYRRVVAATPAMA